MSIKSLSAARTASTFVVLNMGFVVGVATYFGTLFVDIHASYSSMFHLSETESADLMTKLVAPAIPLAVALFLFVAATLIAARAASMREPIGSGSLSNALGYDRKETS